MANETRAYRLSGGMNMQTVAKTVESFLTSSKGMEAQVRQMPNGYVVEGKTKSEWKTVCGLRLTTSVQLTQMNGSLNVTVGGAEWVDKIIVGVVGFILFITWPLFFSAIWGAYQQSKLPEEIFRAIDQSVGYSGGVMQNPAPMMQNPAPVMQNPGPVMQDPVPGATMECPSCHAPCNAGDKFCNSCGAPLSQVCPKCGEQVKPGTNFCPECGQPLT